MLQPRPKVLVADDDHNLRQLLMEALPKHKFEVYQAADGQETWDTIRNLRPDIVLLDIQLPDLDGFAVATVLVSAIDAPVVVLVSSRSRTDYGSRIEDCGARGYIAKAELSGDAIRLLLAKWPPTSGP